MAKPSTGVWFSDLLYTGPSSSTTLWHFWHWQTFLKYPGSMKMNETSINFYFGLLMVSSLTKDDVATPSFREAKSLQKWLLLSLHRCSMYWDSSCLLLYNLKFSTKSVAEMYTTEIHKPSSKRQRDCAKIWNRAGLELKVYLWGMTWTNARYISLPDVPLLFKGLWVFLDPILTFMRCMKVPQFLSLW